MLWHSSVLRHNNKVRMQPNCTDEYLFCHPPLHRLPHHHHYHRHHPVNQADHLVAAGGEMINPKSCLAQSSANFEILIDYNSYYN